MRTQARYLISVVLGSLLPVIGVLSVVGVPQRTTHSAVTLAAWYAVPVLIAAVNLWTSWGRAWLWKLRHNSLDGFRFVSGLPAVGTLAAGVAALVTAGDWVSGVLAVTLAAADTGGLTWFAIQAFRHRLLD